MADFAVSTSFRAKDKVTKSFRDMDKGAARFGRTSKKAFRDATKSASRFRDITKGILAAGAVSRGLNLVARGVRSVTEQFIDFDQATIGAAARFKDIGPEAANFEQQLKLIRDRAREAGATTEFTAAQSAEALNFLAKAGFSSAEAMGSLDSMINLATATGEDFATVADFSSDLLGAFGLNVDDTAQKIQNLARLNDVLVKSANTANVTVEDMFETLKDAAPIGTKLGQSVEDLSAITAFLGGVGIKGSKAGTALKNAFLKLSAPSSTATKMLEALGVEVADSEGNMRGLNDIIGDLAPHLNKMGNVQAAKVLNEIFGKRAIAGAINIGEGTEAIKQFQKSLRGAGGTAEATADRMRKSLGNRIKALISAASEFGFKLMEAFEVRGENAIDVLTNAIRKIDPKPIIEFLEGAIIVMKLVVGAIKIVFKWWNILGSAIGISAAKVVGALEWLVRVFEKIRLTVLGLLTDVRGVFILAFPFGAIIAGVTLLVSALIWLVKNFDTVKLGWQIMVDGMKTAFFKVVNFISNLFGTLLMGILVGMREVADFFGRDTSEVNKAIQQLHDFQTEIEAKAEGRTAPNQEEAAARQEIGFKGRIQIAGAPDGTTAEAETRGAPPIEMEFLGGA
jgi:TP901 family phage tail tape measure protein